MCGKVHIWYTQYIYNLQVCTSVKVIHYIGYGQFPNPQMGIGVPFV